MDSFVSREKKGKSAQIWMEYLLITEVTFCDVKKFISRVSCSVKENDMVFKEKMEAELNAHVKFPCGEGDVLVKEIVHRCGISRASVYCCLKSANQAQKKSKKRGPESIDQSMCARKGKSRENCKTS